MVSHALIGQEEVDLLKNAASTDSEDYIEFHKCNDFLLTLKVST